MLPAVATASLTKAHAVSGHLPAPPAQVLFPVDAVAVQPLRLGSRNSGCWFRGNYNIVNPHPALPAEVDSRVVAVFQQELLKLGRPPHQHSSTTAGTKPLLGPRVHTTLKDHLVSLPHIYGSTTFGVLRQEPPVVQEALVCPGQLSINEFGRSVSLAP